MSNIAEEIESPGILFPQWPWWTSSWNSFEIIPCCGDYDKSSAVNFSLKTLLAIGMTPSEINYLGKSFEIINIRTINVALQLHDTQFLFFFPFLFFLPVLEFSKSRLWLPWLHLLTEVTLQVLSRAVGLSADMGSGTQDQLGGSCDSGHSSSSAPFTHIRWGRRAKCILSPSHSMQQAKAASTVWVAVISFGYGF